MFAMVSQHGACDSVHLHCCSCESWKTADPDAQSISMKGVTSNVALGDGFDQHISIATSPETTSISARIMTANDTDAAVLEGPLGSDVADLDTAAEELEVEDPGLRDLAIRLTENALHQGSVPSDSQAGRVGDEQGGRGDALSAPVKSEPVDAPGMHSGQQLMTNNVDTEMQLLQVSDPSCEILTVLLTALLQVADISFDWHDLA